METIRYETRKARKEHSCDYCRRKIKPGEKRTFELLQKLSHNIAFHYGFGKKR